METQTEEVGAKDKATGKEQKIRIEASSGLSQDEIDKMRRDAEANADADKKAKETIEKINHADQLIFSTEKQMSEYGDKIPADKKEAIESALGRLKDAHKAADLAAIDSATTDLNAAWQAASGEMYSAQQGQPGADGGNGSTAGGNPQGADAGTEGAQDVEYEEVDKK